MGTQRITKAADNRALATIGMSLGLAALFATSIAAVLVAAEIQSSGISWQNAQQLALEMPRP
jgi:H+/Cl- antiporter ClcA